MVVVIVEHFLDEVGRKYFPDWIMEVRQVLKEYKGFHSIQQIRDKDKLDGSHLILYFENLDLLWIWAKSKEHDQLIAKLLPFKIKKQQSQVYEFLE